MDAALVSKFKEAEISNYPEFHSYEKPLEMGLWILWIAKEKIGIKKLSADDIAELILDAYEISVDAKAILRAFSRAGGKVHTHKEADKFYYEIMKPGKDYLISLVKEGTIDVVYFEADKRFTGKRLLSKHIFDSFKGDLLIVDPYCGARTLDVLSSLKKNRIHFLTKVDNLRETERGRFLRDLEDFKSEHANVEFRNYPHADLHDRYVISSDSLVILGHSFKDLGSKESFAVILNQNTNKNIVDAMVENFNRRWKQASIV